MYRSSSRIIGFVSLALVAAAPIAAHTESPEFAAIKPELSKALDEAIVAMFKPGDLDPHWNKSGVDLEKLVREKPNHVLVEVDKEGERSVSLFSDRPITDFIPPEWELIDQIGTDSPQPEGGTQIEISVLEAGYYVASRSTAERVGDAFCSRIPAITRLYKMKGASEAQMTPEIAAFIFRGMLERGKPYTVCVRHDVMGEGFGTRFFLKDGRSLPVFDDMSGIATIVPARPTMELLKGE